MISMTSSNEELFHRRRRSRILYYLLLGHKKSDIISGVAIDFECSEVMVARDIEMMNEWIISLLPLKNSEMEGYKHLKLECRLLYRILYKIYNDKEKTLVGLNALKNISYIWDSQSRLMENSDFFKNYIRHQKDIVESKNREKMRSIIDASVKRFKDNKKNT